MSAVDWTYVSSQLSPPQLYAHLALLLYVLGFLAKDSLVLRGLVLVGTFFYVVYYGTVVDEPLWEAIVGSCAIMAANIYSAIRIIRERSTVGMSQDQLELFAVFNTMNPGNFRRIMSDARVLKVTEDSQILEKGAPVEHLYFIRAGEAVLSRNGKSSTIGPGHFIGELAFLSGAPATASVSVTKGSEVIAWDRTKLHRRMERSPEISNAVLALFNRDLVGKLSVSWPEAPSPP
ncbi:MAG: cyclic nucleotide-binding domain-containing protein [Pseudomonadota bacterium]